MARAYSVSEILSKKYKVLDWGQKWVDAFGRPEISGVWFVYGNSQNGKSSFIMQIVRELAKVYKVFINELEEGTRLTFQNTLNQSDIHSVKNNVIVGSENNEELSNRLRKRKSPHVVIINSIQYTSFTRSSWLKFKNEHSQKLIIVTSHVKGTVPEGQVARFIRFDADLKIWTEGFRAISNGRYNPGGIFTIWEEGANKYWGQKEIQEQKTKQKNEKQRVDN